MLRSSDSDLRRAPDRRSASGNPGKGHKIFRLLWREWSAGPEITVSVAAHLFEHRFVTIVGPGGIGKTTVALAVADSSLARFKDRVFFVDRAALSDPALVPSALASAVGIAVRSENPPHTLVSFLKDKEVLLVLDSCEHVIEAAASVWRRVFLVARGERIYWLRAANPPSGRGARPPAASPREPSRIRSHYGRRSAHVPRGPALLVERAAAASLDAFELTDADAPVVADICRRLDGIALAIEIAAGRAAFGIAGLAALLDDRFRSS